jgi:hypothetical protein
MGAGESPGRCFQSTAKTWGHRPNDVSRTTGGHDGGATLEEVAVRREVCAVRFAPLEWTPRAGNNRLSISHRARLRL